MKQIVKMLALDLDVGDESELLKCPKCEGGRSGEKSFGIRRQPEGLLYHCFRASCGARGFVPTGLHRNVPVEKPKKRKANPFYRSMDSYTWVYEFLEDKFPAMTEKLAHQEGVMYSEQVQRILFPCYNHKGYRYAWNARAYPEFNSSPEPKSILYFDNLEQERLHFPVNFLLQKDVTVVEDQVSAMIGSQFAPCIALMGTDLTESSVQLLCSMGIKNLRIALDPDATQKSIKIHNKYRLDFQSVYILTTNKDIKDLDTQTLLEVL